MNSVAAFFSPFTRAWELALGALVAVVSVKCAQLPRPVAMAMTWIGIGGILVAAFTFTTATPYPGSAAALPVVATALVIAGGAARPRFGGELLLGLRPFQWMGKLSYSFYLWHWPILIIAGQFAIQPLSVKDNLLWLLVALALSIVSYFLIENPIRHWNLLARSPSRSVILGLLLVGTSIGILSFEIASH